MGVFCEVSQVDIDAFWEKGCRMEQLFLGIDLGTSAMKLVLMDGRKNVLTQITENYQTAQPDQGWSEIDPQVWFDCMRAAMEKALSGCDRKRLRGIGITGQMHTLVALDGAGQPVRPAIMWNDIRTKELIPKLKKRMETFDEGEYLSKTISTGSPAANLYWMKEHEPESFKRIRKFLIGPDYLVYRLTGVYGTDYCEASTSCLYQIHKRQWSREMKELLGLSWEVYPPVRGSVQAAGTLTPEMARLFSLEEDVKVLTGTGDNPATAISTGCLGRGYPVISLGTSGVLMMPVAKPEEQAKGKMILFSFDGVSCSYLVQGVVQSNGNTFEWWTRNLMGAEDFSEIDKLLADGQKRAPNSSLVFYPHLMGDKTLYGDPDIRGAFIGLSAETKREDMLYAVVEGLCFSFRQLAEEMHLPLDRFGAVKVVGGGAKSHVWVQTLADVLRMPIEKMDGMIGPAFGIALLAAYHEGCFASLEQISEGNVQVERCFMPDEACSGQCERRYQIYKRMQAGLKYITEGVMPIS